MNTDRSHTTVMLHEAVDGLAARGDGTYVEGTYVDGTFGRGGHTRLLLSRLGPSSRVIAFDKDPEAIANATRGPTRIDDPRFTAVHAAFSQLPAELARLGITAIDGLLLDLGVSSPQIDTPERGFSFRFDGPLDMRMDTTRGETAAEFLARADERQIAEVIRDYGEERFAVSIAKAVVAGRAAGKPLGTTAELSHLVAGAVKTREAGQDPATRTFQALRIYVNAELEELKQVLAAVLPRLSTGGRLAVISFHSLEDRIVKNFIAHESREEVDRRAPFAAPTRALTLRSLGRVKPGPSEVLDNPRSRSAILRVAERL